MRGEGKVFGKFFASTFTGSMVGAGSSVFAVWGYVIANARNGSVELNPQLLAMILGDSEQSIQGAIDYLCSPDERSRTADYEGRRLLARGAFLYDVPNHDAYRKIANEVERREYFREKKAESRERAKALTCGQVLTVNKSPHCDSASDSGEGKKEGECRGEGGKEPEMPAPLAVPKFQKAWDEFVAYRKEHRFKPLKPSSIEKQWKILALYGPDIATLAIEQSIANGWQGIFPEKVANGTQSSGPKLTGRAAEFQRQGQIHNKPSQFTDRNGNPL